VFDSGAWGTQPYYPTPNPVDVPDAQYIARFSTPVTVTPFYTWWVLTLVWFPFEVVATQPVAAHTFQNKP